MLKNLLETVPKLLFGPFPKETLGIWGFSIAKVPLIIKVRPKIVQLDKKSITIKIPLCYTTRNHLHSMYFGTLMIGADLAAGVMAVFIAKKKKLTINFAFKSVQANFLKRVEGDAHFYCEAGEIIQNLITETVATKERVEAAIPVKVYVPDKLGDKVAAEITMTISLKYSNGTA